jgi:hypothetical protein
MPCHCPNDVIYMEEAKGDPSKATLGVNDADTGRPGLRSLLQRRRIPGIMTSS